MILDRISNYSRIARNPSVTHAFDFLQKLDASSEEKRYFLDDDRVFVIVKSCGTAIGAPQSLEAHRRYLDVHFNIEGIEAFEWNPLAALEPKGEYMQQPDAMLYVRPNSGPLRFTLPRGHFVAFFPEDAHGAQLASENASSRIKKAVLKIHLDLISPGEPTLSARGQRT